MVAVKNMKRIIKRSIIFIAICSAAFVLILSQGWISLSPSGLPSGKPVLSSNKKIYRVDEKPHFVLSFPKPLLNSWLDGRSVWAAEPVQTKVYYDGQEIDLPVDVEQTGQGTEITIEPDGLVKPGKYTVETQVATNEGPVTTTQNFAWGVLAVNTDKSIYLPGESTLIQMAVLSSTGNTICDAPLSLTITDPAGQTSDLEVVRSGVCSGNSYVEKPDYTSAYKVDAVGRYKMQLQLADSDYTLTDYFEVSESVLFDITRTGPTRIYPLAQYAMQFKVHVSQNFSGTVTETLPPSFQVTTDEGSLVTSGDSLQQIQWQVNWTAGGDYTFSYRFKTPPQSPAFYFIGPLTFTSQDDGQVFKEARRWQLAVDAPPALEATDAWARFAGSDTRSFTVPASLSNSVLLYFYESETRAGFSNLDVGSVQWNNVNLALLDIIDNTEGASSTVEVWYLANPDAGTLNFEWGNATVSSNTRQGLAVYSGASQSIPTNITEILDPDDPSGTLTGTTSGNLVMGAFGASGSDLDTYHR